MRSLPNNDECSAWKQELKGLRELTLTIIISLFILLQTEMEKEKNTTTHTALCGRKTQITNNMQKQQGRLGRTQGQRDDNHVDVDTRERGNKTQVNPIQQQRGKGKNRDTGENNMMKCL